MSTKPEAKWHRNQVEAYTRQLSNYQTYASALHRVFRTVLCTIDRDALVQSRTKSIESFEENCGRTWNTCNNPVDEIKDLCGSRVIVHTLVIERNCQIDCPNMLFQVRLKAERAALIGFTVEECAVIGERKAELQVRTLLEHARVETNAVAGFQQEPPFEAYIGEESFLFVSYSHKDATSVYRELDHLHRLGFRIWYDEGIDPGNEWPEEVARALDRSSFFLVFISPRSVESQNVRNEIHFALNNKKPFLAVYIEDTALPKGLELRMGDIQAIFQYRMNADRYHRQMEKSLPNSLKDSLINGETP
jgi:hypothetical protein